MSSRRFSLLVALCCVSSGVHSVSAAPESPSPEEPIAVVDGVAVTRATLNQTLEGIYGQQLLPQLIDNQLLENALKGRGLTVSEDEVNAEMERLLSQDPSLESAIVQGGLRVVVIRNQVRRSLVSQKLLTSRIAEPTPAQLQAFFATYVGYYSTPAKNKLGILATSTKARADQMVAALKSNPNAFAKLVEEQKGKAAADQIAGQSNVGLPTFESPEEFAISRGIPPQLVATTIKALTTAKKGQTLPLVALMPTGPFVIIKVVDRQEAVKPALAQIKSQVETDYKLAQAAQAELKKSPMNQQTLPNTVKQVIESMSQPNPTTGEPGTRPSLRDVFTIMLRPATNSSLAYLRSHTSLVIPDPAYAPVAGQYRKQP
ncbi:peptidyl-prolyl cis-trans isomerase [bacterium]|nr:MAG: peptidyl-prolyl cis-trans isomerase [bacterium]